ncbi:YybH family protein [Amycolatopsis minnesotensis]|uniref:SgcJ/EcaC family oxidoreductase n=1 Tax=Amycolatopsis minnesotensis TaxID=337894 RepID=A0ABN2R3K2_9PSEU
MTDTKAAAEIRQLMADREQAMRTGDADLLASHYAPDAVQFDLEPPLLHPAVELRDPARMRNWFAKFGGRVHYDISELTVTAGEDVAFCRSLDRMGSAAAGFEMWFRSTIGFRRDGERWLIVDEHRSTPFYMDGSFLAATDLQP